MPTALLIVDHGSRREEANQMLHGVGDILRRARPDIIVHVAHMELAEPTLRQGIDACVREGASEIIVHPYMLSPGRHATEDIPRMATEAGAVYPDVIIRVTEPLGLHAQTLRGHSPSRRVVKAILCPQKPRHPFVLSFILPLHTWRWIFTWSSRRHCGLFFRVISISRWRSLLICPR